MSRAEVDLQISVKKACSPEEVPPKRKHVRACIVYTWDHKNSRAFWNAVKIQPLQSNDIQLFKALIMIHKVLQEGHPNTLKDGYRNRDFLSSLGHVFSPGRDYGRLIDQYDRYIMQKLDFHRNNPAFNGIFEYEEYISLRAVNDPNEGYEAIMQLMELQDSINEFQKTIFATLHRSSGNLCKVSAFVPLIAESYGIYKFCTSMLRAMYQQLGDDMALKVLFDKFDDQHYMLRDFYSDAQGIKFLASLITIPRLSNNPPSLQVTDDGQVIPPRPRSVSNDERQLSSQPTSYEAPEDPPSVDHLIAQQTFNNQQEEQQRLQQQLELQRQRQLEEQLNQQRLFEEQQRLQEARFLQEQQSLQQQQTVQNQSRVAELEHDLLMFKNQFDNDQSLLQQYDSRVKNLETELSSYNNIATQQVASKDEQIKNLEDQIASWAKKYESLALLYSQLRQEHLNLLSKFKKIQQKINSAQESIIKKEKFEKELKAKNVELADLIRERDRARLDVDRVKASKDKEIEKLSAQVRELNDNVNDSNRFQSMNLSSIMEKHTNEMNDLKSQFAEKEKNFGSLALQDKLKEKELDLEIAQESLESALSELALSKNQDDVTNAQIDHILLDTIERIRRLIDVFLINNSQRIQDINFQLYSSTQAGNLNSSPEYLLTIVELCSDTATDFATAFNDFIAEGKRTYGDDSEAFSGIILTSSELTSTLNDLMLNAKGIIRSLSKNDEEQVLNRVSDVLSSTSQFFTNLTSDAMKDLSDDEDKIDKVIDCNLQLQNDLQELSNFVDTLRSTKGLKEPENLEDALEGEFKNTAQAVYSASNFLSNLLKNPEFEGDNFEVHQQILSAAKAITDAVALLIRASTETQREIVTQGRGNQTRKEFYKKNNRWTEGLISASKAVAGATNILIRTADGVLRHTSSHEQLIVASNEVAASTAQLVAASRVKANFKSNTQDSLEKSSSAVSHACKFLVSKVQSLLSHTDEKESHIDLSRLTPYEGKTVEMEQQVEILKLENQLSSARKRLGEIRSYGYQDDVSVEDPN